MKNSTATTKTGKKIRLTTDDTFTLAIGKDRIESTPQSLSEIFSVRTLQSLKSRTKDQGERAKLEKAIILSVGA